MPEDISINTSKDCLGANAGSVLGILCSPRKYGNSEIILKECLIGAMETGAETSMLRLADFDIKPCRGCLRCVFGKSGCQHKDDMVFVLETINRFSTLVIASPVYFFGVPGIVKVFFDRLVLLYWYAQQSKEWCRQRNVVLLSVGGVSGWDAFALPTLSGLALALGGRIKGSHQFLQFPGPGEILLDSARMEEIRGIGSRLWEHEEITDSRLCPVCHNQLFRLDLQESKVLCPLCNLAGKIGHDRSIIWPEVPDQSHRWSENALLDFVDDWIIPSKNRFEENSRVVRKKKKPFMDSSFNWNWIRK